MNRFLFGGLLARFSTFRWFILESLIYNHTRSLPIASEITAKNHTRPKLGPQHHSNLLTIVECLTAHTLNGSMLIAEVL